MFCAVCLSLFLSFTFPEPFFYAFNITKFLKLLLYNVCAFVSVYATKHT